MVVHHVHHFVQSHPGEFGPLRFALFAVERFVDELIPKPSDDAVHALTPFCPKHTAVLQVLQMV
jgi:hypothetical protein